MKGVHNYVLIVGLFLIQNITYAQNRVTVNLDYSVDQMLQTYTSNLTSQYKKTAWTVMLESSKSKTDIDVAKQKFQSHYSTGWTNWEYKSPYYKLMAGVFATKLEAERMLFEIKEYFPRAFPVKYHNFTAIELVNSKNN